MNILKERNFPRIVVGARPLDFKRDIVSIQVVRIPQNYFT